MGRSIATRRTLAVVAGLLAVVGLGIAHAQGDLSGRWAPVLQEDWPERLPGPELGDYSGLPLSEAGRAYADNWSAARFSLPEHQCRSHTSPYITRSPIFMHISDEVHPLTKSVERIVIDINNFEQRRVIHMDGREHPSPNARHTWQGFSTGRWEGNMLTVTTTHIKHGYHRRNGVPQSDRTTLTEHFIRHGDLLTHVSVTTDPVFLTEPLVKSQHFLLNNTLHGQSLWTWPCEVAVEVYEPDGRVPQFFPGENPNLNEIEFYRLPPEAFRGGSETLYPGFIER